MGAAAMCVVCGGMSVSVFYIVLMTDYELFLPRNEAYADPS